MSLLQYWIEQIQNLAHTKNGPSIGRKDDLSFSTFSPWTVFYCRGFNIWNILKDSFANNMYWALLLMCQAICFAGLGFFSALERVGRVRIISKAKGRPTRIIQGNSCLFIFKMWVTLNSIIFCLFLSLRWASWIGPLSSYVFYPRMFFFPF